MIQCFPILYSKQLIIISIPFLLSNRYNELLFLVDTCQAETLYGKLYSPNIIAAASSRLGEDSLSVRTNLQIILAITYIVVKQYTLINKS